TCVEALARRVVEYFWLSCTPGQESLAGPEARSWLGGSVARLTKQLLSNLVARTPEVGGDVLEDSAQRSYSQRVVLRDGDVVLWPLSLRRQSHVTARLT